MINIDLSEDQPEVVSEYIESLNKKIAALEAENKELKEQKFDLEISRAKWFNKWKARVQDQVKSEYVLLPKQPTLGSLEDAECARQDCDSSYNIDCMRAAYKAIIQSVENEK